MSRRSLDPILRKLREAEGYLELDMPEHALELLHSRQDWATVQFEASYLTGEALRRLGRCREASDALEVAAKLRPGDRYVAISQGWCYKRTHRLAQAIDALDRARKFHPDDPLLRYNLACYWSLAGNLERCLTELAAAIALDPRLRMLIANEPDFDPVRHDPEFTRLIEGEASAR